MELFPQIEEWIAGLDHSSISISRKEKLQDLSKLLKSYLSDMKQLNLNFICTHNSRRSHLTQIWTQVLAHHFSFININCFSGGTESTQIPNAIIHVLQETGLQINQLVEKEQIYYTIKYTEEAFPILSFSKKYSDEFNPKKFIAIMTCAEADEGCPIVIGAQHRFSLPYQDPKQYDNTSEELKQYQLTCRKIATEIHYLFTQLNLLSND